LGLDSVPAAQCIVTKL
jgi:hypothetical protein